MRLLDYNEQMVDPIDAIFDIQGLLGLYCVRYNTQLRAEELVEGSDGFMRKVYSFQDGLGGYTIQGIVNSLLSVEDIKNDD